MTKTIPARRRLSTEAEKLKAQLIAEFQITDTPGLAILQVACQAFDSMEQAQKMLDKHGAVYEDEKGKPRTNPAMVLLRDSRQIFLRAMRDLDFAPVPKLPGHIKGKGHRQL
jgi:P27 family predicted phage terminase small subunit